MDKDSLLYDIVKEIRDDVKVIKRDLTGVKVKLAGVTVTVSLIASYFYKTMGF